VVTTPHCEQTQVGSNVYDGGTWIQNNAAFEIAFSNKYLLRQKIGIDSFPGKIDYTLHYCLIFQN